MATLSEVYREHPLHLRHIIPLDFSSLSTLPDSHAWLHPDDDDSSDDDNLNFSSSSLSSSSSNDDDDDEIIPMIDLADPNAMEDIRKACENWGAFQLKNHGVAYSVIEDVEKEAKKLFGLPTEQKLKALRSPGGATGYGRARISPFFPKYMWHEGFTIMGSPSSDAKKIWPNHYSKFCEKIEKYEKQMRALSEELTSMMFQLLGIPEEEMKKWVTKGSSNNNNNNNNNNNYGAVQLNYYPCCPEPKRAMGLAPHTDTSLFTILHQSQTNGLQIFKQGKGWVPLNPKSKGTLIVHTGDFLHILSNASFKCALHRVVVNSTRHRYSVAYFHNPPLDYVLSPSLLGPYPQNNTNNDDDVVNSFDARFRKVSVKEYIGIKAKNFGQALSLITTT